MSKYVGKIVTNQAPAGYSVFFDGNADFLTTASNAAFAFGTGDYTIEAWIYPTSIRNGENLIYVTDVTQGTSFGYNQTQLYIGARATAFDLQVTYAVQANTWTHVAASRQSGTVRIFANGVLVGSGSVTRSCPQGPAGIGDYPSATGFGVTGYISNVRVLKGTALYTAAFTPPTQLFNVTNTSLLTCNSPAIVDQSSNAFAITTNGNAAVSTFTPFAAYVPYNPALGASTPGVWTLDEAMQAAATRQWNMYDPYFQNTTLLLHGNGTNAAQNNTFLDSSSNNFTITRNGNTTQGTFSPFSQTGWSSFFNGSSTISLPSNAAFNLSSGTWTFEAFLYLTSAPSKSCRAFMIGTNNNLNSYVLFAINTDLTFGCGVPFSGTGVGSGTTTLPLNQWNHVAISMSSSTGSVYLNGVRVGNQAGCTMMNNVSAAMTIGQDSSEVTVNAIYAGYMASARIVKGAALYSGLTCTVPTSPLTAVSGTSFLTFTQNRFVDLGSSLTMTLNGTPSVQAFSPFYPTAAYTPATIGGSGYFDGTGDYLTSATNTALQLGSSDFSIEWWEYRTALNNVDTAIVCGDGTFNALLGYYNSGFPRFYLSTTGSSWNVFSDAATGAIAANSWNHFVLTRSGTAFRVFLNGVLSIYATGSGSVTQTTNQIFISGGINGSSVPIEGYMAGVRFVKGSIPTSYQTSSTTTNTSIFTPPTTPVTTTSQGATSGDVKYLVNFTNAGIVDSTAKNVLETVGNAQISTTQSKFGGSSMYFDGAGDNLVVGPTPLLNFGASDFTIEFWIYPANFSAAVYPLYSTTARAKTDVLALEMGTGGTIVFYATASGGGVWSIASAATMGTLTVATWNHIALVRNGSSFRGYVNGVQSASLATNSSALASFDGFNIGTNGAGGGFLNGYMDDIRITRFARYTAAFTPQTSQWQDQ